MSAMEELDRQIVDLLVRDGRMSYTDLGKATGLSTSAVHQRVRRLEQRGVIRGYAAVVDPEAVGLPLTAFISVKPFDPSAPDDIAERLAGVPEIEACHSVAGDENYILKVRVATPAGAGGPARPAARPRPRLHPHHRGPLHPPTRPARPACDRRAPPARGAAVGAPVRTRETGPHD
ncbi:hypothetical protein GCM10020254_68680 [Streptomyces goshikiensis]